MRSLSVHCTGDPLTAVLQRTTIKIRKMRLLRAGESASHSCIAPPWQSQLPRLLAFQAYSIPLSHTIRTVSENAQGEDLVEGWRVVLTSMPCACASMTRAITISANPVSDRVGVSGFSAIPIESYNTHIFV